MKKVIAIIAALFIALSTLSCSVYASKTIRIDDASNDACKVANPDPLICGKKGEADANARIGSILNAVYGFVGVLAVIVIVIGGVMYMTSAGDPAKVARAKTTIMYAVIGLVVVLLAFAITTFVINATGGKTNG